MVRISSISRMVFSLGVSPGNGVSCDGRLGISVWRNVADALLPALGRIWISRDLPVWSTHARRIWISMDVTLWSTSGTGAGDRILKGPGTNAQGPDRPDRREDQGIGEGGQVRPLRGEVKLIGKIPLTFLSKGLPYVTIRCSPGKG